MLRKIAFVSCAVFVSYNFVQTVVSADERKTSAVYTEEALLKKASEQFKKAVEANKDGHIDRVACTFKMSNNKPAQTAVKTYFSDYHRKPSIHQEGDLNVQPDAVYELTYIKATNKIALIERNADGKRVGSKIIELTESL